jgi:hypothetical protein|tara:strand:+ start:5837 stop:5971 length:135 start_codon:yes stop_codon:yes gene_type:complete
MFTAKAVIEESIAPELKSKKIRISAPIVGAFENNTGTILTANRN